MAKDKTPEQPPPIVPLDKPLTRLPEGTGRPDPSAQNPPLTGESDRLMPTPRPAQQSELRPGYVRVKALKTMIWQAMVYYADAELTMPREDAKKKVERGEVEVLH